MAEHHREGNLPPAVGDHEPEHPDDEPVEYSLRELERLHEIFGRYPQGLIRIREEKG